MRGDGGTMQTMVFMLSEDSANCGFYAQTQERPCRDTGRECHDLTCSLNGSGRGKPGE